MQDADPTGTPAPTRPTFEVTARTQPNDVLLAGFANFGLAGLTAVNFLVDHLDLEQTGHITAEQLPAITPFEDGVPRHHTRLFTHDERNLTVLTGELFVPLFAADSFSAALFDWIEANDASEVAVVTGIPVPHGPDDHRVFYIATGDYRQRRLEGTDVPPMGSGFLGGVNASLLERGIDSPLAAAVYVTPVHAQAPDVEAAIRLVEAVDRVYGLGVDTAPLEAFASEVQQYYAELAKRMEATPEVHQPDDRMYM